MTKTMQNKRKAKHKTVPSTAKTAPRLSKPASTPKPAKGPKPDTKSYIVFGADEYARPRAAKFSGVPIDHLANAVEAMKLRLFAVTGPDLADIAKRLPIGRLHANGLGLVPFIKGDLYQEIVTETACDQLTPSDQGGTAETLPANWDEVGPGHLVIAKETHECGWWEAIVVERTGDLVTLRYRDFPNYAAMVRHRSAVALIGAPPP